MVVHRTCSFCAGEIEPGTGQLFVKRDGSLYSFCSSSCRKQQMGLGRVGHRLRWTHAHELKRLAEQRRQPSAEAPAPSPSKAEGRKPKAAAPGSGKPKKSEPSAAPKKIAKAKPAAEAGPAPAEDASDTPKKPKAKKPAAPSDSQ
jgi:large subunit ribosomal protein L24e